MDATLNGSENRFVTIADLHELVNTLRIKVLHIFNVNHGCTMPTYIKKSFESIT